MDTYKVYIFGIVALALALSVLSFHLLSDKKKKKLTEVKFLTSIYIFVLFGMIVLMLLIMIEFYKGPQIILTNNDNYQLVIPENLARKSTGELDKGGAFYLDPDEHFYIANPSLDQWQEPKLRSGLRDYLERAGLESGRTNVESFIKWNPYRGALACVFNDITVKPYDDMMMCLQETLLKSSYGLMLRMSASTVFEYGDYLTVQVRPQFTTPLANMLRPHDASLLDSLNRKSDSAQVPNYVDLTFINYLNITVLDKSKIPVEAERLTLANYFLKNTINLSSNVEKIISNEKMMLFTSSLGFEKAKIGGETKDFQIHRWVRMIEEPDKLYIIEMAYCPETDEDGLIWKDQKLLFESFGLVTE